MLLWENDGEPELQFAQVVRAAAEELADLSVNAKWRSLQSVERLVERMIEVADLPPTTQNEHEDDWVP